MLRFLLLLCFIICLKPCQAQYFDTLHIHYNIGVAGLQQKDKAKLDILAKDIGSRKILIYSYADYLGSEGPNQQLSDNRANEVKGYLLKKGISQSQIMECKGLGMVNGSGDTKGDVSFRRTDIFIKKDIPVYPNTALENSFPASGAIASNDSAHKANIGVPIVIGASNAGRPVNLKYYHFLSGHADVKDCCKPMLDALYNSLKRNPALRIKLEGHVCCSVYPDGYLEGTPNWELSVARARFIYDYLVGRGIAANRLEYAGYGHTRPIKTGEKDALEGTVNMRVEVRVLDK